jgi:hypothetical protein
MKFINTVLILILGIYAASSQSFACLPDSLYRDSTVGVYPKPVTAANPNGGINKPACINKPYEFVLTIKIPDTTSYQGFVVGLKSAKIATTGAIKNLPAGLTYMCNPPDCIFPALSIGCIILKGTPESSNTPGKYKPIIALTLNTVSFGSFDFEYPGSQFPGEYILTLLDENCLIATEDHTEVKNTWYPNPNQGTMYTNGKNIKNVRLYNNMGKMVYSNLGTNMLEINHSLTEGLYFINWYEGDQFFTQKMWIKNKN